MDSDKSNTFVLETGNSYKGLNFDPSGVQTTNGNWGVFGYGTYKIVFTWSEDGYAECYYEMDKGTNIDLTFKVKSINGSPVIYYASSVAILLDIIVQHM